MIPQLPDYSEFLNQEGVLQHIEEEWLKNKHIHEAQAKVVNKVLEYNKGSSLIEIGCATGNLASLINSEDYLGIDKNPGCIGMASDKNKGKKFICEDVRTFTHKPFYVVCAFAIMKHFGLHEWDEILSKLVKLSDKYVIFDMPLAFDFKTIDDGELHGHHHVWMNEEELRARIMKAGLSIVSIDYTNQVEPIFVCKKI
jgi:hypothetical protein